MRNPWARVATNSLGALWKARLLSPESSLHFTDVGSVSFLNPIYSSQCSIYYLPSTISSTLKSVARLSVSPVWPPGFRRGRLGSLRSSAQGCFLRLFAANFSPSHLLRDNPATCEGTSSHRFVRFVRLDLRPRACRCSFAPPLPRTSPQDQPACDVKRVQPFAG